MPDPTKSDGPGQLTENTVIALFETSEGVEAVSSELSAAGYPFDSYQGEDGRKKLAAEGDTGFVRKFFNALGDEYQVVEKLDQQLSNGMLVVAVDTAELDAERAVEILNENGGQDMWKFDDWTYTRVATEDDDEDAATVPDEEE
jgi:hypothetical protein